MRGGFVGKQAGLAVEHAFGERKLGFRFLEAVQRCDQIGLRLHHFGAVDLKQRVAAFHVVTDLGDQSRDSAGKRG